MYLNLPSKLVSIDLPSGILEAKVDILDYTGRKIKSQKVTAINTQIDIANLATGAYIIRVWANEKLGTQQLVKK